MNPMFEIDRGLHVIVNTFSGETTPVDPDRIDTILGYVESLRFKPIKLVRKEWAKAQYAPTKILIKQVINHMETKATEPKTQTQAFLPKRKTSEGQSQMRSQFDPSSLTEKDCVIIRSLVKLGTSSAEAISADIGFNINQINGAVSVLMAKGLVATERVKQGEGKPVRVISLINPKAAEALLKNWEAEQQKRIDEKEKAKADREAKAKAKADAKAKAKAEKTTAGAA